MRKPAAGNHEAALTPGLPACRQAGAHQTDKAGSCEKTLRDLLLAAASPDNLDAFLRRIIAALSRQDALGPRTGLAVTLRPDKNTIPFAVAINFTKEEQRRLSEIRRSGSKWPKDILSTVIHGGAAKGFLLARLAAPASRACAGRLLEIAAKTINGRLTQESREGQLTRERDVADAITHLEELYLAFPAISLEEISRTVLDEARRLTGSRFGFAGYINPATGWLQVPTLTDEIWKNCRVKKRDAVFKEFTGLWGWVLKNKKSMLTNSADSDPRAKGVPRGHIKIEKFAAAPAVSGKKLIGILALANPPGDYPPAALDAVTKLARVYALMLRHKLAEQQQQAERLKHKSILDSSSDMIYNRAAGRLAESELKYRKIAALLKAQQEASPDAILVVGKDGRIRSFNRHFTKMWGLPPKIMAAGSDKAALRAVRNKLTDPQAFLKRVKYLYRHPNEESRDTIFLKDGRVLERYSTAVLGSGGEYYGRTWHFQDTTESKKLETELAIARAADALSKVARPIAHDFNNALAAINGYATLIDDDLPASSPIKTEISRIIEAVKRAAALTSRLQDFARNPKIENPGKRTAEEALAAPQPHRKP